MTDSHSASDSERDDPVTTGESGLDESSETLNSAGGNRTTEEPAALSTDVTRGLWGRTFRLAVKELRETLRDRRTIVTLILMPILVYPLLAVAFQKFVLTSYSSEKD